MDPIQAALSKAAISSVAKCAGWSLKHFGADRRRKRIEAFVSEDLTKDLDTLKGQSDPLEFVALSAYLASVDFTYVARLHAQACLVYQVGKSATEVFDLAEMKLHQDLTERGITNATDWSRTICSGLNIFARQEIEDLGTASALSPKLAAEFTKTSIDVIRSAGEVIASSLGITERSNLASFVIEYKAQMHSTYGEMKLPHAGTSKRVPYDQLFVEPAISLRDSVPGSRDSDEDLQESQKVLSSVSVALAGTTRAVILGDPGGGKSTLSLKYVSDVAASSDPLQPDVPFLVTLRDYAPALLGTPSLSIVGYMEAHSRSTFQVEPPTGAIEFLIQTGRGAVVFDGLDELLDPSHRLRVVEAVEAFAHKFPLAPVLVTSRRVGYDVAPLDPTLFPTAELAEFSYQQTEEYARNWFSLDETISSELRSQLTRSFMEDSGYVSDLRSNPLLLSLMCGLYATERYIPRNRPDIYEKCANLLFDRWDKQRGIDAGLPFDALVQQSMRVLALHFYRSPDSKSEMSRAELVSFFSSYFLKKRYQHEDEAEDAANQFLDFCKGRAWVLTDVGSETYSFTHRTFLEYFAASQLVRENTSASALYAELTNELSAGGSSVVHQLALQILGKSTEDGADAFIELLLSDIGEEVSSSEDAHRVAFCVEALTFLVPHPRILNGIIDLVSSYIAVSNNDPQTDNIMTRTAIELQGSAAENMRYVQERFTAGLVEHLSQPESYRRAVAWLWNFPITDRGSAGVTRPHSWSEWKESNRKWLVQLLYADHQNWRWANGQLLLARELSVSEALRAGGFALFYEKSDDIPMDPNGFTSQPLLITYWLRVPEIEEFNFTQSEMSEVVAAILDDTVDHQLDRSEVFDLSIFALKHSEPSYEWVALALPFIESITHSKERRALLEKALQPASTPDWVNALLEGRAEGAYVDLALTDEQQYASATDAIRSWTSGQTSFFV